MMTVLGWSALLLSIVAFALAVTALARNLRNKLILAYSLMCTVVSSWAFTFFLEQYFRTGVSYKIHLVFNLALAPVGIFFVRVLTRVNDLFLRSLYVFSLVYFFSIGVLRWTALGDEPFIRSLALFAPSFLVIACVYLMVRDWAIRRGSGLSARRSWVYLGALAVLGSAAMDHIPFLGEVVPAVGNLFLCLYLFFISEGIIHQRLLNIRALFSRITALLFISLIFTVIYTVLVAWIQHSWPLFVLNSFLASFILIVLVEPVRKLARIGVLRVFNRKFRALDAHVQEAQKQLTGALDAVGLSQLTLQFLENTLECESATVFVLRSDGSKFRRIRGLRDDELTVREVLANHPVVEFFSRMRRRGDTPIILNYYLENEIDRSVTQAQKQAFDLVLKALEGLNANIAIPFLDDRTVLGFVAVRASNPPEPWGTSWGVLSVIYPFFTAAARTLKDMDVYVRLREKDRLAALGQMAAGLAHEIRNPLGAIKGAAQILEPESAKLGNNREFLRVIVEEVNRLNKVVTQFLDYSRPLATDLVEYDVGQLLERTAALYSSSIRPGGSAAPPIPLSLVAPEGGFARLPKLHCAPEQIKQVLVNLVQNAMQSLNSESPLAAPAGVQLGASLAQRQRDGQYEVVVFVEDNGKGIPKENLEKIFIPFFTTSPGGTGLGLPICSRIVEAHGGRIEVLSEEGVFTRFSVHLPVSLSQ